VPHSPVCSSHIHRAHIRTRGRRVCPCLGESKPQSGYCQPQPLVPSPERKGCCFQSRGNLVLCEWCRWHSHTQCHTHTPVGAHRQAQLDTIPCVVGTSTSYKKSKVLLFLVLPRGGSFPKIYIGLVSSCPLIVLMGTWGLPFTRVNF
jgi:hypothetical protein